MALSTTFTQCAPETTKFGKRTQNKGHFALHSGSFKESAATSNEQQTLDGGGRYR